MPPTQFAVLARGRRGAAPARVAECLRTRGATTRDRLARCTSTSPAGVSRAISALLEARVVRERPDLAVTGTTGRPSVPVELDDEVYVVVGLHLGRKVITVACSSLNGHCLRRGEVARGSELTGDIRAAAQMVADQLRSLRSRVPIGVGVVASWSSVGIDPAIAEAMLADELGLDVILAEHLVGVAAASLRDAATGDEATAYVYARDTLAYAVQVDLGDQVVVSGVADLRHFPSGSDVRCGCGRTGCLQVTASDTDLAARAVGLGITTERQVESLLAAARGGDMRASELLRERSRILGQAVATVRDMVRPDRIVLVGDAFEMDPVIHAELVSAFGAATSLAPIPLTVARFRGGIQAASACAIAIDHVAADPLAAIPRMPRGAQHLATS